MNERTLDEIVSVLTGNSAVITDWYEAVGFMECHRIAGLLYNRAKQSGMELPKKISSVLRTRFELQKRRVNLLRIYITELSNALSKANAKHIFLKGSVFSNSKKFGIYADGERSSNDIDLLVKPTELTAVSDELLKLGYVQGEYHAGTGEIKKYGREEIIRRRMTRGEVAPFVKLTNDKENPFIEIDINFSLGNTPSDYQELLSEMVDTRIHENGKAPMFIADNEMFFIHLIMHQHKESVLYMSVERGKDLDLYKLADIYYLWNGSFLDKKRLQRIVKQYNLEKEVGAVCGQVAAVFRDGSLEEISECYGKEQPQVLDYFRKKKYCWTAGVRERILKFNGIEFLREAIE